MQITLQFLLQAGIFIQKCFIFTLKNKVVHCEEIIVYIFKNWLTVHKNYLIFCCIFKALWVFMEFHNFNFLHWKFFRYCCNLAYWLCRSVVYMYIWTTETIQLKLWNPDYKISYFLNLFPLGDVHKSPLALLQELLMDNLGDHIGCRGLNLKWLHAKQAFWHWVIF